MVSRVMVSIFGVGEVHVVDGFFVGVAGARPGAELLFATRINA